jgi:hypothetical protein
MIKVGDIVCFMNMHYGVISSIDDEEYLYYVDWISDPTHEEVSKRKFLREEYYGTTWTRAVKVQDSP